MPSAIWTSSATGSAGSWALTATCPFEHQVTSVFHGGDMPLSIPENDPLRQIADISTDDLEGYGIPP